MLYDFVQDLVCIRKRRVLERRNKIILSMFFAFILGFDFGSRNNEAFGNWGSDGIL